RDELLDRAARDQAEILRDQGQLPLVAGVLAQYPTQQGDVAVPSHSFLQPGELSEVLRRPAPARLEGFPEVREELHGELEPAPGEDLGQNPLESIPGRGPVLLALGVEHES